jgi:GntR family transcriptional regulator/MocR family aminotransferase
LDLHLDLARTPGSSLRARLERALREAVREGRLAAGMRLPSTRALAAELGVSRGVVVDAYAQLAAEGYLLTHRGGGTTVAGATAADSAAVTSTTAAATAGAAAIRHDLRPVLPALGGFPRTAWASALARVLRSAPDERLGYPDPAGVPELRETLAAYLGRVRGVRANAEQVIVTSGLRQGVGLVWAALAEAGARRVAVEHPGWHGMADTARDAGLQVMYVPVDENGLIVKRLWSLRVDAVAVAPAHQYPSGAVLSPERRAALLVWARRSGGLIVEDDYDAEYRYDRQPIGSLQGLAPEHVAYGGSASKMLAPAVRLGWLVLPQRLVEPVRARQHLRGGMPAPLLALALADLIDRGELDRHLRRQRRRYAARRRALLDALATELPETRVRGAAAGLHAVLDLPAGVDEQAVLDAAAARGVALEGLGDAQPALVVGYGNLVEGAVGPAVRALAESIRECAVLPGRHAAP